MILQTDDQMIGIQQIIGQNHNSSPKIAGVNNSMHDWTKNTIVRLEKGTNNNAFYVLQHEKLRELFISSELCGDYSLHEVRTKDTSKIYFDIDMKVELSADINYQQLQFDVLEVIKKRIISEFRVYNNHLDLQGDDKFDIFKQCRKDKVKNEYKLSWHILLFPRHYSVNVHDIRCFVQYMNQKILKDFQENEKLRLLLQHVENPFDACVYAPKNGNLRLPNCYKLDRSSGKIVKGSLKQFIYQHHVISEIQSHLPKRWLVSNIDNLTQITLTQESKIQNTFDYYTIRNSVNDNLSSSEFKKVILNAINVLPKDFKAKYSSHKISTSQNDTCIFVNLCYLPCKIYYCEICKRSHDKDTQRYLQIYTQKERFRFDCHRNAQGPNKKPSIYFTYDGTIITTQLTQFQSLSEKSTVKDVSVQALESKEESKESLLSDESFEIKSDKSQEVEQFVSYKDILTLQQQYNKHLTPFPENFNILFIKSQMGTGKTKNLFDYIKKHVEKQTHDHDGEIVVDSKIIVLSFRITFSIDFQVKINQYFQSKNMKHIHFDLYKDMSKEELQNYQYLIIQIESLNRLGFSTLKNNLLIMDESESVISQLNSELSLKSNINYFQFNTLLLNANQVICLDAFMSQKTINTVTSIKKKSLTVDNTLMIVNTTPNDNKYTFYIKDYSSSVWLKTLIQLTKDGKNIIIPCNVSTIAQVLYNHLLNAFPQHKDQICIYTQNINKSKKEADLLDVNQYWKKYRILIYSPTILAGISFEQKHFDYMFGIYRPEICSVENFMQMVGRVRDISEKQYHIFIDQSTMRQDPLQIAITTEEIDRKIQLSIRASCSYLPNGVNFESPKVDDCFPVIANPDFYSICLENIRIQNLSLLKPFDRFLHCFGQMNHNVIVIAKQKPQNTEEVETTLRVITRKFTQQQFKQIQAAELIDPKDYAELSQVQEYDINNRQFCALQLYELAIALDCRYRQKKYYHSETMPIKQLKNSKQIDDWKNMRQYIQLRQQYKLIEYQTYYQYNIQQRDNNPILLALKDDHQNLIATSKLLTKWQEFEAYQIFGGISLKIFSRCDVSCIDAVTIMRLNCMDAYISCNSQYYRRFDAINTKIINQKTKCHKDVKVQAKNFEEYTNQETCTVSFYNKFTAMISRGLTAFALSRPNKRKSVKFAFQIDVELADDILLISSTVNISAKELQIRQIIPFVWLILQKVDKSPSQPVQELTQCLQHTQFTVKFSELWTLWCTGQLKTIQELLNHLVSIGNAKCHSCVDQFVGLILQFIFVLQKIKSFKHTLLLMDYNHVEKTELTVTNSQHYVNSIKHSLDSIQQSILSTN